ncbi:MAG: RagB/SusD family nutrient uptake outer membrane protein [Dysgonomonas sp.]|nr:RagB/SusD family nutrient uptake outer membrane protein [Dysgonomonas sp.]
MKAKNIALILTALVTLLLLPSCENLLKEEPKSFVNKEQFYKNKGQCLSAVNGCFIPLNSMFNTGFMTALEACTDLAFLNSSELNAKFEISPANPGMGAGLWTQAYRGIMYCNAAYVGLEGAPIDEKDKNNFMAEVVTLRAYYYYVLTSTFGDVPFYRDDVSSLAVLDRIAKLPRMSAVETRNSLIEELQDFVEYLPAKKTSDITDNRISSSMAYILIAKMSMWNKKYDVALEALKEIQLVYGTLDQYSLTDTFFRNKNTPESIFEIQYTWSATGLKKTTNIACIFTPAKSSNSDIYDGVSIPELGSKANPYNSITPSDTLVRMYDKYKEPPILIEDPRGEMVIARTYNGTPFNRPKLGKPWMGPKFWCPGMDNVADGNNQKVFRYADALLLMAECANELENGTLAIECINQVKKRAGIPLITEYKDKYVMFDEIKEERARELMGEYTRKWDLVRWGTFYNDVLNSTGKEYATIAENLRPFHEYYPIPDNEVVRSGGILTNDAYTGF